MTILANLAKHVTWRFARRAPTAMDAGAPAAPLNDGVGCTRCKKPVEDAAFKYCRACRAQANKSAKKRARKHKREGCCPKCGGPRGVETVVCSACLAKGRATYHNRKG